jgi:hypothetical protein
MATSRDEASPPKSYGTKMGFFAYPLSCPAWDEGGHPKCPIISSNGFATSSEEDKQPLSCSHCLA